jgi:hypothetical protein
MQPPILFIHPAQRILLPGSLSGQSVHEYTPKLLSEHFVIFARTDHFCHTPRQFFSGVVSCQLLLCRFSEMNPQSLIVQLFIQCQSRHPNRDVRSYQEIWICTRVDLARFPISRSDLSKRLGFVLRAPAYRCCLVRKEIAPYVRTSRCLALRTNTSIAGA